MTERDLSLVDRLPANRVPARTEALRRAPLRPGLGPPVAPGPIIAARLAAAQTRSDDWGFNNTRRGQAFERDTVAGGQTLTLSDRPLPENARVVEIAVHFADSVNLELEVYPVLANAATVTADAAGLETGSGIGFLLDGPAHYLRGNDTTWSIDVRIAVPEQYYLGFLAINNSVADTHTYHGVIVVEEWPNESG